MLWHNFALMMLDVLTDNSRTRAFQSYAGFHFTHQAFLSSD